MQFVTSLFIFLVPTLSLIFLQYLPQILSRLLYNSSSSPAAARKSSSTLDLLRSSSTVSPSSVWCCECNRGQRCCDFRNLYFFPQERTFGFVLTDASAVHGLTSAEDMQRLLVGSVVNHTQFFLPLVVFTDLDPVLKTVKTILREKLFLLKRFKPDNVMHAVHDDLLPLFSRFETLCSRDVETCSKTILLTLLDNNLQDVNSAWYSLLSAQRIFKLSELKEPVLISEVYTGLPGSTVVFQYGFGQPQGAVSQAGNSVGIYQRFSQFVKNRLKIKHEQQEPDTFKVVLISRKETRKILNEEEVSNFVISSFQNTFGFSTNIDLQLFDPSGESVHEMVDTFGKADFIIGMHGAATFLAGVFSRPNASIVEMFPFGINPTAVSPLQALSEIKGAWFSYVSWENKDLRASVPPSEEAPRLLGGLAHLSEEERKFAKKLIPVPAVYCCHNATYLYRMFQDTIVGPSVQYSILKAIEFLRRGRAESWTHTFLVPSGVRDLVCLSEAEGTKMFWKAPLNVHSMRRKEFLKFEISARSVVGDLYEVTETKLFSEFEDQVIREAWVRACTLDTCGKDAYVLCK
ncbi:protein O-linked-mannose beta-1,4-N-acetylglucosaminyltransferase 2-like [Neocloeon triangulifer]|uniref:protein O-linked-mannose beta-1,4-N-acetylglucosaminyltransferase 2-like n=1 Tax=Neocloeon triangulifer TaxID=2078957 RepID=UPI00286F8D60|nr:protein O-linked-mannose beta-1,4-N-acetylglucosaminyltransferase 2-like [Neocloeon triangulifer]